MPPKISLTLDDARELLRAADARADGHNPLCGDRLTVTVRLDGESTVLASRRLRLEPNRRGGFTVKVLDFGLAKLADA